MSGGTRRRWSHRGGFRRSEAAGEAPRDGRAPHRHHLAGFGGVAVPRGDGGAGLELVGPHGAAAGSAAGLPAARLAALGLWCFTLLRSKGNGVVVRWVWGFWILNHSIESLKGWGQNVDFGEFCQNVDFVLDCF